MYLFLQLVTVVSYIYPHTLCEHVHIPATSIPQKKTSRKKPTITTNPTMVPTAIPAMTPGDKPGRAVVTGGKRVAVRR